MKRSMSLFPNSNRSFPNPAGEMLAGYVIKMKLITYVILSSIYSSNILWIQLAMPQFNNFYIIIYIKMYAHYKYRVRLW